MGTILQEVKVHSQNWIERIAKEPIHSSGKPSFSETMLKSPSQYMHKWICSLHRDRKWCKGHANGKTSQQCANLHSVKKRLCHKNLSDDIPGAFRIPFLNGATQIELFGCKSNIPDGVHTYGSIPCGTKPCCHGDRNSYARRFPGEKSSKSFQWSFASGRVFLCCYQRIR